MPTKKKTSTTAAMAKPPPAMTTDDKARLALLPSVNGVSVIKAYQGNVMGKDVDINLMVNHLCATFTEVKGGDLHTLEAMLISQATALQTIFSGLALRAQDQTSQRNLEAFLGLALKAQAQSRATITALVDLKYPRQATFVKQANIANRSTTARRRALFLTNTHKRARTRENPHPSKTNYWMTRRMFWGRVKLPQAVQAFWPPGSWL